MSPALAVTFAQSALAPAGREAERLAALFWWMTGGAVVIWLLVAGLAFYAARFGAGPAAQKAFIVWGGAIIPTAILAALLAYGLPMLQEEPRFGGAPSLTVEVVGEQWWWRVRYPRPGGGPPIELANEIRLPVGETALFELRSADVIHSFWIPPLAGKMDMFPGRPTRLAVHPTKTGRYRGACAEYCGASHALMAFDVVVSERPEFDAWLAAQAAPAKRRSELFASSGCAACHAVRGTEAAGAIGPDLTHVGSRLALAAGTLPNDAKSFDRWLERTHELKPGARMPRFAMLPASEREALAAYLESLR